jgi:hypothetical protein
VTVLTDLWHDSNTKQTIDDIEKSIQTISEVDPNKQNRFQPKYADLEEIDRRVADILEIHSEDAPYSHESGNTLGRLQQLIDSEQYDKNQTSELQSMGFALGDYIQSRYDQFQWIAILDEFGRVLALEHVDSSILVFPITMISKRVENDEEVNMEGLVNRTLEIVSQIITDPDRIMMDPAIKIWPDD